MTMPSAVMLPDLDHDALAAAARSVGKAGSIGFRIGQGGLAVTYRVAGSAISVTEGLADADTVVVLDERAWADLTAQMRTYINLFLAGAVTFERGGFNQFAQWDPALRFLHAGIPVYDPDRADLGDRDPQAVMTLDADDDELRAQLDTMGYLHLRGVFTADEMIAVNAEVDRLAALARPGDDKSWWAVDASDNEVLCRLVYTTMRSELLASIENDPRLARLGHLIDPEARVAADRMEGTGVLLKAPGETKGLSNIPWHQDCGMGGHALLCPALSIGIQITGSSAETGNLQVIPGSQGQTMHYQWERELGGVPVVSIDTSPGDVTVHVADVMHASPKPSGAGGRRTMYVTFYPPTLWDHVGPGEAFNDLVRNRTTEIEALVKP